MKKSLKTKICIIGGGAAGIFAATTASFFEYENVLIEKNPYLGGQVTQLYPSKYVYDFPTHIKVRAKTIIDDLEKQMNSYSHTTVLKSTGLKDIKRSEDGLYDVYTDNDIIINCEYIILATGMGGFNLNKLELNNQIIEGENIHYTVDTLSDIYKNKKIVILGGGDSAVDWANYFIEENITKDVSIVHRRNEYRAKPISVSNLSINNVKQYLDKEVLDVNNNTLTIKNNDSDQIDKIDYDFLIVQYGQTPTPIKIDILNEIEKYGGRYKIDLNQKTNIKNIYAIGESTYYNAKSNTIITACADATKVIWHIRKNKLEW